MSTGYPDFYGQPIFEKLGPYVKIKDDFASEYPHTNPISILDISAKGVLEKARIQIAPTGDASSIVLETRVDDTLLDLKILSLDANTSPNYMSDMFFTVANYDRYHRVHNIKIVDKIYFNSNININISIYGSAVIFCFYNFNYRRII